MRYPGLMLLAGGLALLVGAPGGVHAQQQLGTPVDRNVADTGANAASLRVMQPGLGQFGVGSLLLDRYSQNPNATNRYTPDNDTRASQRYIMQAQGFSALIDNPEYVGPSPHGGWVRNKQTLDGREIFTLTGANTVYVLSPELLRPNPQTQPYPEQVSPYLVQPQVYGDPYAIMRNARVNGQPRPAITQPNAQPYDDDYVHPDMLERRRKLREERAAEDKQKLEAKIQAELDQAKADNAASTPPGDTPATGDPEAKAK